MKLAFLGIVLSVASIANAVNYPFVATSGASLGEWTAATDYLFVSGEPVESGVGERISFSFDDLFKVTSGSDVKKISFCGLPKGVTYNSKTRLLSGKTTKRGISYVTASVENANKFKHSCVVRWNVGGALDPDYNSLSCRYGMTVDLFL